MCANTIGRCLSLHDVVLTSAQSTFASECIREKERYGSKDKIDQEASQESGAQFNRIRFLPEFLFCPKIANHKKLPELLPENVHLRCV